MGDHVDIVKDDFAKDKYIITKVYDRKNSIPRPVLSNIDKLLMIISCTPKPDFYLIDKLYVYCMLNNIEPVLVVNKSDICEKVFIEDVKDQYYFIKTFVTSAKERIGINELKEYMKGSLCAVCGQSAVGKSSIINSLIPNIDLQTQTLSVKIDRGKHTTRVNQIFTSDNIMVADTPGFSSLDLDIDYRELMGFYPEFNDFIGKCKYLDCSHIKEGKDCEIVSNVNLGKINKKRYERYVDLYNKLKEKWEKKYD